MSVVGKLAPWKNQDHIIDAIKRLEAHSIYINLFILGSGKMKEEWVEKAGQLKISKVHFPGFVKPVDLPAYYAASDIYVHPASMEPHSIAISEAIYMGCPVIISDRCGSYGNDDDVQEGKNGSVFQFGNIEQLALQIKSLANDVILRKKYASHSHDIAVQFQYNAHFDILKNLINRLN